MCRRHLSTTTQALIRSACMHSSYMRGRPCKTQVARRGTAGYTASRTSCLLTWELRPKARHAQQSCLLRTKRPAQQSPTRQQGWLPLKGHNAVLTGGCSLKNDICLLVLIVPQPDQDDVALQGQAQGMALEQPRRKKSEPPTTRACGQAQPLHSARC